MKYKSLHFPEHLYFITDTVIGWKNIFEEGKYLKIILESLSWLRLNQKMFLFSFVIMPSHLHFISKPQKERSIAQVMQKFNSFTGHKLTLSLIKDRSPYLKYFQEAARSIGDRKYRIWENPLDKNIFTEEVLWQKMEYIHNNPIQERWRLVEDRADYPYSSACFYDRGVKPIIEIDDVRDYY